MATSKIFINPEEIKNSAAAISRYNESIKENLNDFTVHIETVDWEALGRTSMKESFDAIKPSFDKFYNYIAKVVTFLNQNVADDAVTLDTAIQGNATELKSR